MKYDVYGSHIDGSGKVKVSENSVPKLFSEDELEKMKRGESLICGIGDYFKFWAVKKKRTLIIKTQVQNLIVKFQNL